MRTYFALVNALLIAGCAGVTYACVCTGGSFDIDAMRANYAPRSWQLVGLSGHVLDALRSDIQIHRAGHRHGHE